MPNSLYRRSMGAEAPKPDMPTKSAFASRPRSPNSQRSQPRAHTSLDGDADGAGRQDAAAVGVVLCREQLHAGHRDDAGADALGLQQVAGFQGDFHLGAGGHQDDAGVGRSPRPAHRHPWRSGWRRCGSCAPWAGSGATGPGPRGWRWMSGHIPTLRRFPPDRRDGRPRCWAWRGRLPDVQPVGASGRLHRGRCCHASSHRQPARPSARTGAWRGGHSR